MRDTYSLYEAKAKLSAIVRYVREGRRVVVTLHGKPVAEIRALPTGRGDLEARLDGLAQRGILIRAEPDAKPPEAVVRKVGALGRFLADRAK